MLKHRSSDVYSNKQQELTYRENVDFSKMRVGPRTIEDPVINLGTYRKVNPNYGNKTYVLNAIYRHDYITLREISEYFYESSGIYSELCNYLAFMYRFDYHVAPYYIEEREKRGKKIDQDFRKALLYLDKSEVKRLCSKVSLDIIVKGVYYGIIIDFGDRFGVQPLPPTYCRSRYYSGITPIVELNLHFFDAYFSTPQQRQAVLKTFPKDVQRAYALFRQGKLKGDYPGDPNCWYPLDPGISVKMSLCDNDFPCLVSVIPSIIDLDQAQELDRQKTMQQLLKIIVQKLPLDKNGDLIFDMDEAKDIHINAVEMLKRAVGVDVLTTFADIIKIDTKDSNSSTTTDDLEKVERTVFNNAGISRNMFNADGNLAVTNAIRTDEARVRDLPLQFGTLLSRAIEKFNRKNKYEFRVSVLETTQYNYTDIAKLYKELAQIGYSKMLPQLALGRPQSEVLSTLTFENEVLHLAEIMIPPMMSSTMSSNTVKGNQNNTQQNQNKQQTTTSTGDNKVGRPEKEDGQKSDKTIANRQSM